MPGMRVGRRRFLQALLTAAVLPASVSGEAAVAVGERPRGIALGDLTGARVLLPDAYGGRLVLVHFWASWCPPCFREMEELGALFERDQGRAVMAVSVNVGESKEAVAAALRGRRVPYPILLDPDKAAARLYGVAGFPTLVVLDRRGTVAFRVLGEIDRDGLQQMLARLP